MFKGFTAVHLGSIVATLWVLFLNGLVGFQLLDDGTPISLGLILLSAIAFFVGTGYVALDTAFGYTSKFAPTPTTEMLPSTFSINCSHWYAWQASSFSRRCSC